MAGWSGAGVFVRAYNWVADKAASVKIVASRMDGEFDNYKTGLENCLTRDGQNSPSGNISWNSKKITSLANGTATTDAVNLGQVTGMTTGNAFRRNMLVNGDFAVWQSGAGGSASIAGTAARVRTADCWWAIRAGTTGYTVSQQTGESSRYALKWQRNAANASTEVMYLGQSLETENCVWLKRGTPPTLYLSFKAKKGANYSGGDLSALVIRGTGTDENVLAGFTGATTLATLTQTLTGTLTRYSLAVPCDTSTNQIGVRFAWTPSGVAGADDSVTLEEVQLEVASAATDFERVPFAETLTRCQRYYYKTFHYPTAPAQNLGGGTGVIWSNITASAGNTNSLNLPLPVPMRLSGGVTGTLYNPAAANGEVRNVSDGADCSSSFINLNSGTLSAPLVIYNTNATGSVGEQVEFSAVLSDNTF